MSDRPRRSGPRVASSSLAIYIVDLKSAAPTLEEAERMAPRLSPDQRSRYQNRSSVDRDEAAHWRVAHVALRSALERHVGSGIRGLPYDIEAGGRPRLSRDAPLSTNVHFSLAHAGTYALIAISHAGPIGADLEVTRQVNVSAERRDRLEKAAMRLVPDAPLPDTPDARFLQAWVRLEALAKASGAGIGRLLTDAGIVGGGNPDAEPITGFTADIRDLALLDGCFAAIAGPHLPHILTVEDFPSDASGLARFLAAGPAQ